MLYLVEWCALHVCIVWGMFDMIPTSVASTNKDGVDFKQNNDYSPQSHTQFFEPRACNHITFPTSTNTHVHIPHQGRADRVESLIG